MTIPSAVQAQIPPPVAPQGWGVNIHFTDPVAGEMARFSEAGYRLARMDFHWARVEKEKGVYDFSPYDRLTETLRQNGVRPLYILDYGNALYDGGASPHTEEGRAAFARFAAAAAARFKGKGVLWEIWNEPNLGHFWKPVPNAEHYTALALATAKAIRAADPNAVIMAPGSSGFPWEFFETMFRSGLLEHLDAVSVHPYRGSAPETAAADYALLRVLIARYAPAAKRNLPILSSEWGYNTSEKGVSEERQAEYLTRQWLANLAAGVNLSIFYDWRDDGDDPKEAEHRFGTVRRNFEPKPSFLAAQRLIRELDGYAFRHRLRTNRAEDWRLLFQKGDDLAVATWVTDEGAPASERMPQVQKIAKGTAGYANLLRASAIRYPAGARAASTATPARLEVTLTNPDAKPATAEVTVAGVTKKATLKADAEQKLEFALPLSEMRNPEAHAVPVTARWNGAEVTELPAVQVYRTDPLIVNATPRGSTLVVALQNPSQEPFSGRVELNGVDRAASEPLTIARGAATAEVRLPMPGDARHTIEIKDAKGNVVQRIAPRRFVAMAGFPTAPGAASTWNAVHFKENAAQAPVTAPVVAAPADGPAPVAVQLRFDFPEGWQYGTAAPIAPLAVPDGATALALWVHGDGSGDALRARLRDSTGQTFQIHAGVVDWKGWKAVTLPLTAEGANYWGGANDGKIHPPLSWDALVLVDSFSKKPHVSEVLLAAPYYVVP